MKILTTHVGSLPGPDGFDATAHMSDDALRQAVRWVVERQRATGISIINEGELTKGGDWLAFMEGRLGGFEAREFPGGVSPLAKGKDREEFAAFYQYAAERQTLFFTADKRMAMKRAYTVCTSPITYAGLESLQREMGALSDAVSDPHDCFLTSTAPASLEPYRGNEFYKTTEEFVFALGEALRVEYEAIANAGFLLQIDDAWLVGMWERIGIAMGLPAFQKYCGMRIEALNHALRRIPQERIRYHMCWGSWHGPHAYDIPLKDVVELLLSVKAGYYSFEAANARHEHEYTVWERVKLPAGKKILPGVVSHSTDIVEHPELVSMRIQRFARLVGAGNVIASTDCGFGGRTHPQIAWAKLRSMCEGAELASGKSLS